MKLAERGVSLVVRRSSRKPDELIQVWAKRDLRRAAYDRAHARGAYALNTGRPRKADPALAQKLKDSGLSFEMIATTLGVSPRTLHRYFKT